MQDASATRALADAGSAAEHMAQPAAASTGNSPTDEIDRATGDADDGSPQRDADDGTPQLPQRVASTSFVGEPSSAAADTKLDATHPDYYKRTRHNKHHADIEDIYRQWDECVPADELAVLETVVRALSADPPETPRELESALCRHRKEHHTTFRKAALLHAYTMLVGRGELDACASLHGLLVKKSSKSQSGVLVITVLTSPYPRVGDKVQKFSCQWNCYYCPNEPGQPRSYLHDEPAVKRANENGFDAVLQLTDRAATLAMNGHPVDKIELLVLGGTWASYPHAYQEEFCRDLFYAANTFWERTKRPRRSLEEEQAENEVARCKIIGLTLETRPDTIDAAELRRLRRYGCTRVQLGLQHTDDKVLAKINRGHTRAHAALALRRLKDACYKVDVHLMPNLPGASAEIDRLMFESMLADPALQADQWKIYPTQVVPWSVVKKWHDEGSYVPYDLDEMFELLMRVKARVHPWIRLNRVVRDIPIQYVSGGLDVPNLRQDLLREMGERGWACKCIRCREVGDRAAEVGVPSLVCRGYEASGASEYFLSFESADRSIILGFVRLRLRPAAATDDDDEEEAFPELRGAALIRELHVYGQLIATENRAGSDAQHTGLGRKLMAEAERRARAHGCRRVAVIAGIGTRGYYRKLGYELDAGAGGFMIKELHAFAPGWVVRLRRCAAPVALLGGAAAAAAAAAWAARAATAWAPLLL